MINIIVKLSGIRKFSIPFLKLGQSLSGSIVLYSYSYVESNNQQIVVSNPSIPNYLIVSTTVTTFSAVLDDYNLGFINHYDVTNFNNCSLALNYNSTTLSANKVVIPITQYAVLSSKNNNFYTIFYTNTGSLIIGISLSGIYVPPITSYPPNSIPPVILKITQQPLSASVLVGDTAIFSCSGATSNNSSVYYRWLVSTDNISFDSVAGGNNRIYTTPTLALSNNQTYYKCELSASNANILYTNSAFLSVSVLNNNYIGWYVINE
jgi:hypothetical protein